jgi:hypothetical protein
MLFLVSLIAAALAWLFGWRLLVSSGLPSRRILRADVGSSFPQSSALTSRRGRGQIGQITSFRPSL